VDAGRSRLLATVIRLTVIPANGRVISEPTARTATSLLASVRCGSWCLLHGVLVERHVPPVPPVGAADPGDYVSGPASPYLQEVITIPGRARVQAVSTVAGLRSRSPGRRRTSGSEHWGQQTTRLIKAVPE